MKTKRMLLLLSLVLVAAMIAGCSASGEQLTLTQTTQTTQVSSGESVTLDSPDALAQMAAITLNGSSASVEGDGATADGSTVTITAGGSYTLTGTLEGQIVVSAAKDEAVELILNGVSISSSVSAAIYAEQSDQLILTLADGTQNTLSDAASYVYADAAEDEPDAALFAKDDLIIRGTGALMIYGNFQNGITTKDNLVIESGDITIQAENHGMRGKDSVSILDGMVTITAGNDGIQSDNSEDGASGTILIAGGTLNIAAGHDGLQAQTDLSITGGAISIVTGGGYTTESYSANESYKALKSAGTVAITGGEIIANSLDDAIHAAVSVSISGGTLTLMSRDDGIHADETVHITGGTIDIQISYEGIEGTVINLDGGAIFIIAADDGINAADSSMSGQGDRMGSAGGWGSAGASALQVNITGGTIYLNAYGDGVDSNGSVTMTGGALYISGPVSSQNGAIDYDASFAISGGVLVAAGAAGMAQTPDTSSSQPSIMLYFAQSQTAGNTYLVTDTGGTELIRYAPGKEFQSIVFSAPEFSVGSGYRIYESADGTLANATLLYEVSLSSTITSVGGSGQTMQNWQTQNSGPQQNNQRRP